LRSRASTTFENGEMQIRAINFFLDGSIAVGMQDGVMFYEQVNGEWQRSGSPLHYATRLTRLMSVAPDNTTLAIAKGSDVSIWDRKTGVTTPSELILRFAAAPAVISNLPSPAVAATSGTTSAPKPPPDASAIAFSPRGWPLAVGYADGSMLLWQPQEGTASAPTAARETAKAGG
jgi:hypothetical protein